MGEYLDSYDSDTRAVARFPSLIFANSRFPSVFFRVATKYSFPMARNRFVGHVPSMGVAQSEGFAHASLARDHEMFLGSMCDQLSSLLAPEGNAITDKQAVHAKVSILVCVDLSES